MNTEELYAVNLAAIGACAKAREFVAQYPSLREAVAACTRADWLAWLLRRVAHPLAPQLEAECVRRAKMHATAGDARAADAAAYAAAAYEAANAADAAAEAATNAATNAASDAAADAAARAAYAAAYAAAAAIGRNYAANADAAADVAEATAAARDAAYAAERHYLCDWTRAALAEGER